MKIGVFDSGIGGLTVLGEIRKNLPEADIFYLGDNANVPYGNKTNSEIKALVKKAAERMKQENIDALVMACNTAAAVAIEEVQLIMGMVPIFGVIEAGVETVIQELKKIEPEKKVPVLVLATTATVKSGAYSTLFKKKLGKDFQVIEQECPRLVSMIEEGILNGEILGQVLLQYLDRYTDLEPGICLLGCTHYPWIKSSIENILVNWKVVESSTVLSEKLRNRMITTEKGTEKKGSTVFLFTKPGAVKIPGELPFEMNKVRNTNPFDDQNNSTS